MKKYYNYHSFIEPDHSKHWEWAQYVRPLAPSAADWRSARLVSCVCRRFAGRPTDLLTLSDIIINFLLAHTALVSTVNSSAFLCSWYLCYERIRAILRWTEPREKKNFILWSCYDVDSFFFTSATEENFLLWFMSHCLGEFMVSWSQRVRNCRYIKCRYIRLFNVCLVICLAVWGYAYREVGIISWMHGKWTLMGTSRPAPRRSVRGMNKHERCPGCELV